MAKKNKFIKKLTYAFGRGGIAFCDYGSRILPLRFLYSFANLLGTLGFCLSFKHRRIAIEGLTMAFGQEKTKQEIELIARDCFKTMTSSAIEFFMFMRYPDRIRKYVEIEGRENLDKALSQGKGVIALSGHLGSFPLLMSRLAQEGYPIHTMLRHIRDEMLDKFFERKRDRMHVGSIYTQPRQQCVNESLRVLRNNEILFIQLDQNFGTGGIFVDFFGRKAATATGPIIFSMRTGAPIVPMFIFRIQGPRHKVIIEPEISVEKEGTPHERIVKSVSKFTVLIESYVRRNPHEWGWIHKRWKARPKEESKISHG